MTSDKTIFEVRRHPLLSAILIAVIFSSIYLANLLWGCTTPEEQIFANAVWGDVIHNWQLEHPLISNLFIWCGAIYVSFKVGQATSRFNLYGTVSYLPMELFSLVAMGVMACANSLNGMVASILLLRAILRFFSSYRASNSSGFLVRSSLALGVLLLLIPSSIVLWGVVLPILVISDRTLREVIVAAMALLFVPFIYMYVGWLRGEEFSHMFSLLVESVAKSSGFSLIEAFTIPRCIVAIIVLYLTVMGAISAKLLDNSVKAQRRLRIVALVALALVVAMTLPSSDSSLLLLFAIPASLLIPAAMLRMSRLLSFIFYIVLLVATAVSIFL